MAKSGGAHRWVRGGTGFLLGMGIVLGSPVPMPSVLSALRGGFAYGQDSQEAGSEVAAEDPCPPVQRGAFSLCRSQQNKENSAEKGKGAGVGGAEDPCPPVSRGAFSPCPSRQEKAKSGGGETDAGPGGSGETDAGPGGRGETDARPGGGDEEDADILEGLGMVGGGLVMTTLGFVVLNNLDSFGTDCSDLSEEVDPSTGKSPKDECMDDNEGLIGLGFLFIVTGVVLTGAGVWTFGEGVVDAVSHHPAPPGVRLGLIPCRECRPAPLAIGVRLRF